MEHRWGRRHEINVLVRFVTRPSRTGIGLLRNISSTGAFMETPFALRHLSVVYLEPVDATALGIHAGRLAATVVRQVAEGVGLEWCEFATELSQAYARMADRVHHPATGPS
jgi:hypothetical protein